MDFKSVLSSKIAQSSSTPPSSTNNTSVSPLPSKFKRRAEIEAEREAAYRAEQARLEEERLAKAAKKRKLAEDEAEEKRHREEKRRKLADEARAQETEEQDRKEKERRKRLGLPEVPDSVVGDSGEEGEKENGDKEDSEDRDAAAREEMSEEELTQKLRSLSEPSMFFRETHAQRLQRYYQLAAPLPDTSLGAVSKSSSPQPISTTLEPVSASNTAISANSPPASDQAGRLLLARRLTTWFNLILASWAYALSTRPEEVKKTFSGQSATNSHLQALSHLKPLFRKLETLPTKPSSLPDDLLGPICSIVRKAQERRYVDANDEYLRLSIGKAAWPIGVTMVGIHERSAREKLNESDQGKAHIMSDEATRKILQSLKRCLSFAQTKWPPENVGQLMG